MAAATAEQEPVPAPVQEVEVDSTTDSGGPQEPPGPRGALQEVAVSSGEAEAPGADVDAAEAPREPPALPKYSIPTSGGFPREGDSNTLQDSSLENLMDRGVWQAVVHGGCKSARHCLATK